MYLHLFTVQNFQVWFVYFSAVFPCVQLFLSLCATASILASFMSSGERSFLKLFKMSAYSLLEMPFPTFPVSAEWVFGGERKISRVNSNAPPPHYLKIISSLCTSGLVLFLLIFFSSLSFPTLPYPFPLCLIHLPALSL